MGVEIVQNGVEMCGLEWKWVRMMRSASNQATTYSLHYTVDDLGTTHFHVTVSHYSNQLPAIVTPALDAMDFAVLWVHCRHWYQY